MIYLTGTNQELDAQVSANNSNVEFVAVWADVSSGGLTPNVNSGVINNTGLWTLIPASQSTTVNFQLTFLALVNTDAANTQNVQLSVNNQTSQANVLPHATLLPGWALQYIDGFGFTIIDADGRVVPSVYAAFASAQANAAYAQANLAYTAANTAQTSANIVYAQANAAYAQANLAYGQANLAYTAANSAQTSANVVYAQANLAYAAANSAQTEANLVFSVANNAANTTKVYANGTLVLANANLNFNNTSTINLSVTANGTGQVNVAFLVNTGAVLNLIASGNTANLIVTPEANGQYQLDTRFTPGGGGGGGGGAFYTNGAFVLGTANANINFNNTASVLWTVTANGATQVNVQATSTGGAGDGNNYQADLLANGTIAIANANLNFNNTATVNVAVTANAPGQGNIGFTANTTALGIVALNAAAATFNTTFATLNTEIVNLNTAVSTINTSLGTINTSLATVNTTFATLNTTFAALNVELVNLNTAVGTINTSLGVVNTTFATVNTTFGTINTALGTMNTATAQAGNVQVFVNGTATGNSVNGNINFVSANVSNLVITGVLNTSPSNVTVTFDTALPPGGGGGSPVGPNNSIQLNSSGAFYGNARFIANLYRGNDSTLFLLGGSADSPFSNPASFSNTTIVRLLTQNVAKGATFLEFANDTSNVSNTFGYFGGSNTGMRFSTNELIPFNISSFSVVTGAVNTYASFIDGTATFYNSNSVQSRISIQSQAISNSAFIQFNKGAAVQGYVGVVGSTGDLVTGSFPGDYVVKNFQANANINFVVGSIQVANLTNSQLSIFGGTPANNLTLLVAANASTATHLGTGNLGAIMVVDSNTGAAGLGNTSIDFNNSVNPSSAKGRISLQANGSGSVLRLGTSNSYAAGITNEGLILDMNGQLYSNTSHVSNVSTQLMTGVAVSLKANVNATSTTLTSIAPLAVNLNEVGVYWINLQLLVSSNVATNTAVGYLFDWGGGSATIPKFWLNGTFTSVTGGSVFNIHPSARTGALANIVSSTASANPLNPDVVSLSGTFQVSVAGTFAPRIACVNAGTAANTVVLANSAMVITKIT